MPMVDGDGTTSQRFTGIAKTTSTDTAAAAGEVWTIFPLPGVKYAAGSKSAAATDTQAEIDALLGARLVLDLTGTVGPGLTGQWTIDTAGGDGSTNAVIIIGGDYRTSTLYFTYRNTATFIGA